MADDAPLIRPLATGFAVNHDHLGGPFWNHKATIWEMVRGAMKAEISFDLVDLGEDCNNIEGCYRLPGGQWQIFYFTRSWQGEEGPKHASWRSGATGLNVNYPKDKKLNKLAVMKVLSDVLGITEWSEVRGPDSLQMK